jgi:putative membrane protein
MKYIYSVLVLLLALFLAAFIQQNGESVVLKYFGWSTPALPLSLYIILAFAAGYVLAVVVGFSSGIRSWVRTTGAEREVKKLKSELDDVRGKQPEQSDLADQPERSDQLEQSVQREQSNSTPATKPMSGAQPQADVDPEPSVLKGVTADELRNALEDEEATDSWDDHVEEK